MSRQPLWHWTCDHGAEGIRRDGLVWPNRQSFLSIAWFTTHGKRNERTRLACGLTSHTLGCDRMDNRFRAAEGAFLIRWLDADPAQKWRDLLHTPGTDPASWWISFSEVPVVLS